MPYCPACGNQHAEGDRFCSRCGRALSAEAAGPGGTGQGPQPPEQGETPPAHPSEAPAGETTIWEGTPHGLLNPIETHAIRWELTTERLRTIRGLLNRSIDEIELTRVRDVAVEQSLTQRALGIGTVFVVTTDATSPRVALHDVAEPEQVKELIRTAVRDQRRRLRVRQLEVEDERL
ncbi:MAG: PH domain-containing protein [Chloroflexi bacterium]|nr:PH domain-containing protein [Chloroflexota bacterium]